MKNNFNDEELTFQEEVTEEELENNLDNISDGYVKKKGFYGLPILIFFAFILVLASLFSIMFSMVYTNKETDRKIGVTESQYNLVVSHSDSSYGGVIENFSKYNSSENSYEYNLSVSNNNSVNLKYFVELENTNYNFDKIDMTAINYKVIKNGVNVKTGKLKNASKNDIYNTRINSSSLDEYVIKLWSSELTQKVDFAFKINIGI